RCPDFREDRHVDVELTHGKAELRNHSQRLVVFVNQPVDLIHSQPAGITSHLRNIPGLVLKLIEKRHLDSFLGLYDPISQPHGLQYVCEHRTNCAAPALPSDKEKQACADAIRLSTKID